MFALLALGVLVLILRWSHRPGASVVPGPVKRSIPSDYGLLVPVAAPETYAEGEIMRRRLESARIRANLAYTLHGPRVMVYRDDEERARDVLRTGR